MGWGVWAGWGVWGVGWVVKGGTWFQGKLTVKPRPCPCPTLSALDSRR